MDVFIPLASKVILLIDAAIFDNRAEKRGDDTQDYSIFDAYRIENFLYQTNFYREVIM
ncbi:hypothetical protein GCM10010918_14840 [Paenibacillus radicis (ex Gao et al. 2016)]|uniref:Uncharacterized protein n=1 Tax=Paenibacillus radicis (ex Gao et al. 2016) TaxID=1737354 RepID=A0A917GZV6_9BACL|nr:hypothetical protein GCM10010918_14840 [Paenibacillus radicis (ex Gao et al. 2016)]